MLGADLACGQNFALQANVSNIFKSNRVTTIQDLQGLACYTKHSDLSTRMTTITNEIHQISTSMKQQSIRQSLYMEPAAAHAITLVALGVTAATPSPAFACRCHNPKLYLPSKFGLQSATLVPSQHAETLHRHHNAQNHW